MAKKPKTIIYLLRHARAYGNRRHVLNGSRQDGPLTAYGRAQAKAAAAAWKEKPDVLIASPLKRAMSTARFFAKKYHLKIIKDPMLVEQDCGKFTNFSIEALQKERPGLFLKHFDGRKSAFLKSMPGGESWAQLKMRAKKAVQKILCENSGKKILVVSHGALLINAIGHLSGIKEPELLAYQLRNVEYAKFEL